MQNTWRTPGILIAEQFLEGPTFEPLSEEEAFAAHCVLHGHLYNEIDLSCSADGDAPLTMGLHESEDEFFDDPRGRGALRKKLHRADHLHQVAFWTALWAAEYSPR